MIVAAMLCNLNWAMNDYGIKEISLDSRILAQSTTNNSGNNTSGGGGSTSTGPVVSKGVGIEKYSCTISGKVKANITIRVCGIPFKADGNGNISITFNRIETLCLVTGKYRECTPLSCSEFWSREGVRLDAGGTSADGGNLNGGTN